MKTAPMIALMLLIGIVTPALAETSTGIHVQGRGVVEVEPDMGYVRLHVRREGENAASLQRDMDTVVDGILKLARRLDIAERDVTATAISIQPRYRRRDNEPVIDGLTATRTISVTLRDLGSFGDLMTESLEAGVNNVEPIQLDSSARDELEDEALALAMADATRLADEIAGGFGVSRGPVSDVRVGMSPRPMATAAMAMRAEADAGVPFSPGVIRIERYLEATFSIENSDGGNPPTK
jgi:uncharacterized protein YggE